MHPAPIIREDVAQEWFSADEKREMEVLNKMARREPSFNFGALEKPRKAAAKPKPRKASESSPRTSGPQPISTWVATGGNVPDFDAMLSGADQ